MSVEQYANWQSSALLHQLMGDRVNVKRWLRHVEHEDDQLICKSTLATIFDQLLEKSHIVGTPGSGFGAAGEGFFRLSAFNSRENTERAIERIQKSMAARV